jgi:hypothetical protein
VGDGERVRLLRVSGKIGISGMDADGEAGKGGAGRHLKGSHFTAKDTKEAKDQFRKKAEALRQKRYLSGSAETVKNRFLSGSADPLKSLRCRGVGGRSGGELGSASVCF